MEFEPVPPLEEAVTEALRMVVEARRRRIEAAFRKGSVDGKYYARVVQNLNGAKEFLNSEDWLRKRDRVEG